MAAVSCTADAGGEPEPADTASPGAADTGSLAEAPDQEASVLSRHPAFSPCAEDPELECGTVSVPVDYRDPAGAQVVIATVRAPALTRRSQGVVFVNPGGPGQSGVDFVLGFTSWFAPLRQRFDVVSFDPRGTGRSQPLDCTVELPEPPASDAVAATAGYLDEVGRRYAQACREQFGALATHVGTDDVARDMDVLRASLGERELNYLGYSYGTALGAAYATLFPQRVRAMVLDANVSPSWFSDYLLEIDADGSAGAELALRRLDQLCRAAADCPLRDRGVVAVFDRVVARLDASPVVVGDGAITGASLSRAVLGELFQESIGWPRIVRILAAADAGDYAALPAMPIHGDARQTLPGAYAIMCNDSATRRGGLDYLPAQLGTQAIYPRFGSVSFGFAITACSAWPRSQATALAPLTTRNPVVLIGNDFDSATPMAWSRNMATVLGSKAALVRYQGGGHTIYASGSACIDGAVESYFRDPTAPPRGLVCPALPLSFADTQRAARKAPMTRMWPGRMPAAPVLR